MLEFYTDGACSGNPGPGGWGVLVRSPSTEVEYCGGHPATTNNRMEMTAVIRALETLTAPATVKIYSDSQYVIKGITEWISGWKARGWRTATKDPVKNEDLWRKLDELASAHKIEWVWVKGHSGHIENERADGLARKGLTESASAGKEVNYVNGRS